MDETKHASTMREGMRALNRQILLDKAPQTPELNSDQCW